MRTAYWPLWFSALGEEGPCGVAVFGERLPIKTRIQELVGRTREIYTDRDSHCRRNQVSRMLEALENLRESRTSILWRVYLVAAL
jgi:hypothetical protein